MSNPAYAEVQGLLRFLTHDAKLPLALILPKISVLRRDGLNNSQAIANADIAAIKAIFDDDKITKQVVNAAKRVANPKKRTAIDSGSGVAKRPKNDHMDEQSDQGLEAALTLPTTDVSVEDLQEIEIETNRAPLFLAFTLVVLQYTMPEQPLSSRLSLAQAVVSANSQSKAKSIGLTSGPTAEDDGWAQGQPKVKILNREIAVMRRQYTAPGQDAESQATIEPEHSSPQTHEAFWGLDLEALRKSNGPLVAGKLAGSSGPPVHRPQAARSYLLKSMSIKTPTIKQESDADDGQKPSKAPKPAEVAARKEKAASMVLKSIDLLCESWSSTLTKEELDKRAWSWYVSVRPDVQQGQAGWGQKGTLKLADILRLRKV